MSEAKWTDTHDIYHWRIYRNSYRKLAWVGFESGTTELRIDAITDWATRPSAQLVLRVNFTELPRFHLLFSIEISFPLYIIDNYK